MGFRIWLGISAVALTLGFATLYLHDSATVAQALVVEEYLKDYCRSHNRYPGYEEVENRFPDLYPDREWYYWPDETQTSAAFQYPMTLPLASAPGRSKVSEFLPVIYAYAVQHPCKDV